MLQMTFLFSFIAYYTDDVAVSKIQKTPCIKYDILGIKGLRYKFVFYITSSLSVFSYIRIHSIKLHKPL